VAALNKFKQSKNTLESFINSLEGNWPDFDWSWGISSAGTTGYDSRGIYINFDYAYSKVNFDVYSNYIGNITSKLSFPKDINKLKSINDPKITFHLDRDSIFDYEQYRILINKKIRGATVGNDYDLGMPFRTYSGAASNCIISPDKKIMAFQKEATADDNYSCVYISFLKVEKPDIELALGNTAVKVKWIDTRYLECLSEEISYIYDIQKDNIIPLPAKLFGSDIDVISVGDKGVTYRVLK
jgi:hypothetical protein